MNLKKAYCLIGFFLILQPENSQAFSLIEKNIANQQIDSVYIVLYESVARILYYPYLQKDEKYYKTFQEEIDYIVYPIIKNILLISDNKTYQKLDFMNAIQSVAILLSLMSNYDKKNIWEKFKCVNEEKEKLELLINKSNVIDDQSFVLSSFALGITHMFISTIPSFYRFFLGVSWANINDAEKYFLMASGKKNVFLYSCQYFSFLLQIKKNKEAEKYLREINKNLKNYFYISSVEKKYSFEYLFSKMNKNLQISTQSEK